ncbi:cache domain-containing protein [Sulfuritalea hydrogenivorans]|uniref:cache domain-containing protein n=1 Tax=Sulfuritalea hydrogenivorans TaxID=748811 RepID=UPI000B193C19|nr:cache domain-containing protein [Sulfuritalea hydrogenivorans]MDK9713937.1 cache domain-containing protein [Sulfuritalea sp.]
MGGLGIFRGIAARFRGSLRFKLLALALGPLLVAVPILIGILVGWGAVYYDRLLITKVQSDLAVAHGYFDQVKEGVGRRVESLAGSERLARALRERPGAAALSELLREMQQQLRIDFLILLDGNGRVRAATGGPVPGSSYAEWEIVRRALAGHAETEVDILDAVQLAVIDPTLTEKARTPLIATRNAQATQRNEETRGMVMHAAAPIASVSREGGAGVLVGGLLLNKNLEFVDRINDIVYPEGSLPLGSVGTATLFLDDVRIATNVRLFENVRAIGTRVSAAVRHTVLDEGRTWLDRAFVVNDWYVSAYEPIKDSFGRRVGMLYVGYLEEPFQHARQLTLAAVALLFVLTVVAAAFVSLRLARHVSQPVARMHGTMSAIESGETEARVGKHPPDLAGEDELAELAAHFDRLLDRLAAQTEALQRWGSELDGKVAERTQELAAANQTLRSAQQRLVMSEKLAAIGQLAAGVAHEINNPVAVIQGNLDVLRETLGDAAEPAMAEIRLIQDQVFRIRLIVTKLLQFARPAEYAGYLEPVVLDQVVQDSLVLVAHQMKKTSVAVMQELHATRPVTVNRNELQQVLINLMVNALQAMPEGGTLLLASGDREEGGVRGGFVAVGDSGPGIAAEIRERLFDPFFTTKTSDGTGLGLWVSLGLVQRYGGRIDVECPSSGGSVFTVWLPNEAQAA